MSSTESWPPPSWCRKMLVSNIRRLCKEKGTTIPKVEEAIGLGRGTIYGWAKHQPNVFTLRLVAEYFGVSLDELVGRK